ncbi:hypothetical protein [Alienimonas californiensis]|uniref:Uncharacterized protein n=1 Tax=Alienimonas californiensis TaxID=2527989 RepID=A0A517P591_9PLAN|nr:hypothetical protein [Alienimonas californiensis]QDT14547.1 hypothetical protein CA12_06220 [Alienimonas californiensis]
MNAVYRFAWTAAAVGWTGPVASYLGVLSALLAGERWVGYAVGGGLSGLSAGLGWWLSGRVRSRRACLWLIPLGLLIAAAGWPWAAEVWIARNDPPWFAPIDERLAGLGTAGLCWGGLYLSLAGAWGRWVLNGRAR